MEKVEFVGCIRFDDLGWMKKRGEDEEDEEEEEKEGFGFTLSLMG